MRRGGTLTEHTREAWRPHLGTIDSRTSCVGACRLMASVDCVLYCASLAIALGTPTVEMVMWRAPIFMVCAVHARRARGAGGGGASIELLAARTDAQ